MPQSRLPRQTKPTVLRPSSGALFDNPEPFASQRSHTEARFGVQKSKPSARPTPGAKKVLDVSPRTLVPDLPGNGPKIFQTSPSTNITAVLPRPSTLRGRNVSRPTGTHPSKPIREEPEAGPSEPRRTSAPGKMKNTPSDVDHPSTPVNPDRDPVVSQIPIPPGTRSRSLASVSKLVSKIVRSDHRASDPGPGAGQARVADNLLLIDDKDLRILKRLGRLVSEIPGHEGKGPETVRKLIRGDKLIALHSSEKEAKRQAERDRRKGEKYTNKGLLRHLSLRSPDSLRNKCDRTPSFRKITHFCSALRRIAIVSRESARMSSTYGADQNYRGNICTR